jgi:hypothetical protein
MAIGANPGAGNLLGTLSQSPVEGVATFADIAIDASGAGYTLVASSLLPGGTASATSDEFDVPNVVVPCSGGGCSGSASNATTIVQVSVPGGGGSARLPAGADDTDLAIALNAPNGSFTCGGETQNAIGSITLIDPPEGFTSANPITVTIIYPRGVVRVPLRKLVICKDSGPGTPFFAVPKCAKRFVNDRALSTNNPPRTGPPCEKSRSRLRGLSSNDRFPAVQIVLLITSTDPRLASR